MNILKGVLYTPRLEKIYFFISPNGRAHTNNYYMHAPCKSKQEAAKFLGMAKNFGFSFTKPESAFHVFLWRCTTQGNMKCFKKAHVRTRRVLRT